jgi:7-carboxy-7-deazaguanine synthase
MKMPSSGMQDKNLVSELSYLRTQDQLKFVCADREDFDHALGILYSRRTNATILFSPAWDSKHTDLISWMFKKKN